jgi:hypothetical protein
VGDSWSLNWTAPVEDEERLDKYRAFYTVQDYLAWAKATLPLPQGFLNCSGWRLTPLFHEDDQDDQVINF